MTTLRYEPGWAGGPDAHGAMLAYLPPAEPKKELENEPAYAIADWWEPPSPMAIPPDLCRAVVEAAKLRSERITSTNGTYYTGLDPAGFTPIIDRVKAANSIWWNLDVSRWELGVKHYRPGEQHPEHTDMHAAGGACRKLVAGVQLSDSDDYTGGDFRFRWAHHDLALPRARGTLTVFPGWTVHRVTSVSAGERWALIVNGFGSPLR